MATRSALDILKRILLSFRRNWGLKLASLLFAIILWNYVIVEVNPTLVKTYTGIAVNVQTSDITQLNNSGLTVSGDLSKILKTANVTISIRRNDSFQFGKNNITVVANFSGITRAGEAEIKLTAKTTSGTAEVKLVSPQSITVNIEKRDKRIVPVKCVPDGSAPQGYWVGVPEVTPKTLEVSGPSENVKQVDRAEVHLDLTNQTSSISSARDLVLLDSSGKVLDKDSLGLECQSNCIVNLQIFPTKTVNISAKNSLNGSPARGYEVVGDPVVEPSTMVIAGSQETLDAIGDTLPLGVIDIGGLKSNNSHPMTPTLPKGVIFVGSSTVQVLVNIDLIMTQVTINDVRVTIVGLDSGLKVDKTFTVNATITCPQLYASNIRRSQLHVTADATGYSAGAHTLQVQASYTDPDAGVTEIVTDPAEIAVKLTAPASAAGG